MMTPPDDFSAASVRRTMTRSPNGFSFIATSAATWVCTQGVDAQSERLARKQRICPKCAVAVSGNWEMTCRVHISRGPVSTPAKLAVGTESDCRNGRDSFPLHCIAGWGSEEAL